MRSRRSDKGVGIVAVVMIVAVLSVMGAVVTLLVATGAISKTKDLVREQSFGLDDDWTRSKTNAAPISGTWACTNGVIVLHVTRSECCKAPEGMELRLKVLELTSNSLRVMDSDSKEEMVLNEQG